MAIPRIAINGFGRVGRTITRIAKLDNERAYCPRVADVIARVAKMDGMSAG